MAKLGDKDANTLIGGALGSLVTPKDAPAQMLVLGPPTSDATELQTIAQAVRDEAGWFITASGEINSDAYQTVLRPHRLVLVKGAGTPYSGKYYVTRVVHEMKARRQLHAELRGAPQRARRRRQRTIRRRRAGPADSGNLNVTESQRTKFLPA